MNTRNFILTIAFFVLAIVIGACSTPPSADQELSPEIDETFNINLLSMPNPSGLLPPGNVAQADLSSSVERARLVLKASMSKDEFDVLMKNLQRFHNSSIQLLKSGKQLATGAAGLRGLYGLLYKLATKVPKGPSVIAVFLLPGQKCLMFVFREEKECLPME